MLHFTLFRDEFNWIHHSGLKISFFLFENLGFIWTFRKIKPQFPFFFHIFSCQWEGIMFIKYSKSVNIHVLFARALILVNRLLGNILVHSFKPSVTKI